MTNVFQQHGHFYKLKKFPLLSWKQLDYDYATSFLKGFDLLWYLFIFLKNEVLLVQCPVGIASMLTEVQSCKPSLAVFLKNCLQFNSRWLGETKTTPAMLFGQHYKSSQTKHSQWSPPDVTWSWTSTLMCEDTLLSVQENVDDPRAKDCV